MGWNTMTPGPSGSFGTITGKFNVPGIYPPPGPPPEQNSDQHYALQAWVGIGSGTDFCNGIIQAGVDLTRTVSGFAVRVWWAWIPENYFAVIDMPCHYGDEMRVTVVAHENNPGYATGATYYLENLTRGYKFTQVASGFPSTCLDRAEWIVGNPTTDQYFNIWATFENVDFDDCAAWTTTNVKVGISGTTAIHGQSEDGRVVRSEYRDDTAFYVVP